MGKIGEKIIRGSIWSVGGHLFSLLITFVVNIWLARLLSPKEFGQVGIVMFFILLGNVFIESGLGGALIRNKNIAKEDYSTVFIFNLVISIFSFLLLFVCSGMIADFYNDQQLKDLIIVSGIIFIINSLHIVHSAKTIHEFEFKKRTILRLFSILSGAFVGILCAYNHYGVWSLVYMHLTNAISLTLFYWLSEGLFFGLNFNMNSFKKLYTFGINTSLASILNTLFDNIYQLILGKYFSINQTGLFYQAKKLQSVPGGVVNALSHSVLYSALSKFSDDKEYFTKLYNKINLSFIVIIGFTSCIMYIYAEQIIILAYGEKWLGAAFFMKMLSISSFFFYLESINKIIFKVFNKTGILLYLEILKKIIQTVSILLGIYYLSIYVLLLGFIISNAIGYFINYYFSNKVLIHHRNYELKNIMKVVFVSFISILIIVNINFYLTGYHILLTLPLFISLFIFGLHILNVISIKNINYIIKQFTTNYE